MNKIFTSKLIVLVSLFVLLVICASTSYSQKALQLTNVTSGKKLILKEGYRVTYVLNGSTKHDLDILEKVNESSVTLGGQDFTLDQFKSIGRKRKGSGFWSFACGFVGTGLIIGSVQNSNSDPCPGCTDAGSSGEGWTAVEIGLGLAVLGLGINTVVRNSPRDVVKKWKLEIIDLPSPDKK